MKRVIPALTTMVLTLLAARPAMAAVHAAGTLSAISGTIRDVHGTPQMGALVELLRADSSTVVTALSDTHGRYIMPTVVPGKYELRATAAFFVPVFRPNLKLQAGAQAIVNLTMSALFEADNWLPATRRRADEPIDDWKWALRSTANRPLLRLVDPEDGVMVSSSNSEGSRTASSEGRLTVTNGDGAFGEGGMHQALMLDRTIGDGDGAVFRADVGNVPSEYAAGPSVSLSAGYERRTVLGGSTRLVSSFQTHPELTNGNALGFQVLQMASTQQITLGDLVLIDAGTLMAAERLEQTRIESEPYARISVRPASDVMVEYRFATGRQLQSAEDLDRLKPTLTAVVDANGRPLAMRGSHQEISISKNLDKTVLSASVYTDRYTHGVVAGSGLLDRHTLAGLGLVADPTTGTFQAATAGYAGRGLSASVMRPLTPTLSLWAEYDLGTALRGNTDGFALADLNTSVKARPEQAASLAMRGKIVRTGTALKVQYRWQPVRTLTQVNAYNVAPEDAWLGFYVRQRVWVGHLLPHGMDAVVEATNLLEQGYQPVLAPDGQTLFLAQVPRTVQAGLAFNF